MTLDIYTVDVIASAAEVARCIRCGLPTCATPLRAAPVLASLEDKKSGAAYGSVFDSMVIRLPPSSSSSSPRALGLLLLPEIAVGIADVAVCPSALRPRGSAVSWCSCCSASSRFLLFFLTRPGISFERLLGPEGSPSSRLLPLLSRTLSINESTEFLIPPRSLASSETLEPLREVVDGASLRPSLALATSPLNPFGSFVDGAGDIDVAEVSIESGTWGESGGSYIAIS